MRFYLPLSLILVSNIGLADFEARKNRALERVDAHIAVLNKKRACITQASEAAGLKQCKKAAKAEKESLRSESREAKRQRIDKKMERLQKKKEKLNK